jgi:hypothetical protein
MCGDIQVSPAMQAQLRMDVAQLADEQLLRDIKRVMASPAWQVIRGEPLYARENDAAIFAYIVFEKAMALANKELFAATRCRAEEFGQGGRNADIA